MTGALLPVSPPPRAVVEFLPRFIDPVEALLRVRRRRNPVLLLSGLEDHPESHHSILAWDPLLVATLRGGEATLARVLDGEERIDRRAVSDPFDFLRALAPAGALQRAAPGVPFAGGAIGYLGYGLRRAVERLPCAPPDPLGQPDAWFGLYDRALVFDHRERRVVLVATGLGAAGEREREARAASGLEEMRRVMSGPAPVGEPGRAHAPERAPGSRGGGEGARRNARLKTDRKAYLATVARALEYIGAGDLYQVNLSHRIECPFDGDPADLFADLARCNPAPFSAYLDAGPFQVVSASPERFVALQGSRVRSSPIKGTRPRGLTPEQDARLSRELSLSAKDRAENVMIADLVRNDLGRVCETGSVRVEKLCALESFATVHHLVSSVSGGLRPDADRVDVLKALFPGGSMTGAPKVRAMEIIDELEGEERGIYSGGIGYLSLDGGMDFNIVIRTLVCAAGRAHLRVGGAVVADSQPETEYRETLDKAKALLDALGARLVNG
ncbi:MAG TPA: aminodeoxychorismate synthase component I [Candidatus Polarisedimenticolia bacterium]|nr:aminodeoxychorismate synthase component I [Candidatus Polarisedimenticolia bacterium]